MNAAQDTAQGAQPPAVAAPASAPALRLRGLCKRFGAAEVLVGIDLDVPAGRRLALVGPNGAGKSTLFDVISGRQRASGGQVWLHGRRIDGLAPQRIARLGLSRSFQISQVFDAMSVWDNLRCAVLWRMGGRRVGWNFWRSMDALPRVQAQAARLLADIRLEHKRHVPAAQLGYAQRRALELGLALGGGASVLLLDEPTAGMAAAEARHFVALISRLAEGKTLLVVEHDMAVVQDLADTLAVLDGGRLLAHGAPAAVRADARVRQAYLGLADGLAGGLADGVANGLADGLGGRG